MIGYILSRAAMVLITLILLTAVTWETYHLIDWMMKLYELNGDGTLASYLRIHAKTYVDHIFGGMI